MNSDIKSCEDLTCQRIRAWRIKTSMFHWALAWILASAAGWAQTFRLDADPEESLGSLTLPTSEVVPTVSSVEAELRALESRHDMTEAEREREKSRLQRDYAIAVRMLDLEKAREARQAEAQKQGQEFTRLYLQLDMADPDFAKKFRELEARFPLAIEEPLSRKLIERARRFIQRENPTPEAEEKSAPEP